MIKNFTIIPHYNDQDIDYAINVLDATIKFKKFHRETVYLIKDGGWVWYDSDKRCVIDYKDCVVIK
jgi:hypothetical protein